MNDYLSVLQEISSSADVLASRWEVLLEEYPEAKPPPFTELEPKIGEVYTLVNDKGKIRIVPRDGDAYTTGLDYTKELQDYLENRHEIKWNLEEIQRSLGKAIGKNRRDKRKEDETKEIADALKIVQARYTSDWTHEEWMDVLIHSNNLMQKLKLACRNFEPTAEQICAAIRIENILRGKFTNFSPLHFIDLIPGAGKTVLEILPALLVHQDKIVVIATSLQLVSQTIAQTAATNFSQMPFPFLVRRVDGGVDGGITANFKKGIFVNSEYNDEEVFSVIRDAVAKSRNQQVLVDREGDISKVLTNILVLPGKNENTNTKSTNIKAKLIVGTYEGVIRAFKKINLDDVGCLVVDEWDELVSPFIIGNMRVESKVGMQGLITACCERDIPVLMMSGTGDFKLNNNFSLTASASPNADKLAKRFIINSRKNKYIPSLGFFGDCGPLCLSSMMGMQYAKLTTFETPLSISTKEESKDLIHGRLLGNWKTYFGALLYYYNSLKDPAHTALKRLLEHMTDNDEMCTAVFCNSKTHTYTEALMIAAALRKHGFQDINKKYSDLPFEKPLREKIINSLERRTSKYGDIFDFYKREFSISTAEEVYNIMIKMGVFPINAENISNKTISIIMNERTPRLVVTTSKLGSGVDIKTIGATCVIQTNFNGTEFKDVIQWLARGYRDNTKIFKANFSVIKADKETQTSTEALAEMRFVVRHTLGSSLFFDTDKGSLPVIVDSIKQMVDGISENTYIVPGMHLEITPCQSSVDACWVFDSSSVKKKQYDYGLFCKAFTVLDKTQTDAVRAITSYSPIFEKFLSIDNFLANVMMFCKTTTIADGEPFNISFDISTNTLKIGDIVRRAEGLDIMRDYLKQKSPGFQDSWLMLPDTYINTTSAGKTSILCIGKSLSQNIGKAIGLDPLLSLVFASVTVYASCPQKTFELPKTNSHWTSSFKKIFEDIDRILTHVMSVYAILPDFKSQIHGLPPQDRLQRSSWNLAGLSGLWSGLCAAFLFKNRGNGVIQKVFDTESTTHLPAFVYAVIQGAKSDFIKTILPYLKEDQKDKDSKNYIPKKELGAESLVYEFLGAIAGDGQDKGAIPEHGGPAFALYEGFRSAFRGYFTSHKTESINLEDRLSYFI